MLIGHLPAGYVFSKLAYARFEARIASYRLFMFWGLLGAIAPDFDMFYFHLVDQGQIHHHRYVSHFPILWLALVIAALAVVKLGRRIWGAYGLIFSLCGFAHLVLDTVVGDIWWLAPMVDQPFALASVPAVYQPWWLNFILHWSFTLELALFAWAVWLYRQDGGRRVRRALSVGVVRDGDGD